MSRLCSLFTYHDKIEGDDYEAVGVIQRVWRVLVSRIVESHPDLSREAAVEEM